MIDLDRYVVKEKVGLLKASNRYEMLDPETGEVVFACSEPRLGMFTKMFRMTDYKRYTPFDVEVATPAGEKVVRVKRGVAVLASTVQIFDERDEPIGHFKQKMFTIVREKFRLFDNDGEPVCELRAKSWTGWEFQFLVGDTAVAIVTKKWAGLGKELFTTADNYLLTIDPSVPTGSVLRKLIVAAVMTIDMVINE